MPDLKVCSTPGRSVWLSTEQFTVVLLEKSVHTHLLQRNFPMLRYFKAKTCVAFFFYMQCLNFWSQKFQSSCLLSLRSAEAGVAGNQPYHSCLVPCGLYKAARKLAPTCGVWLAFRKMKQKLEAPRQSITEDPVHDNCWTGSSNTSTGICQTQAHSRQVSFVTGCPPLHFSCCQLCM